MVPRWWFFAFCTGTVRYGDGAGNTAEENSSIFSLIRMRQLPSVLWHCWLGGRKGIQPVKKWGDGRGGHWLVRMEWRPAGWSVSAAVNLPLHHKVQKFSSGTGSPGWSRKKGFKMVVVWFLRPVFQWDTTTTTTVLRPVSGTTWVSQCQNRTSGLCGGRED